MKAALSPLIALAALVTMAATSAVAWGQLPDHLNCYKVIDPLKLSGIVDLNSPPFGLEAGCAISKATLFCVPATKTVVQAVNKATRQPITPLPVEGADPGDRICYKIKCPASTIAAQQVTDQFGTRAVGKFKAAMLCTPAFRGAGPTAISPATPATITCNAEGDQCEPCHDAGGRLMSPGPGVCARGVEGDLRCQVYGCLQPASNCTSSAQCTVDQFCGVDGGGPGVNACCSLCQSVFVARTLLSNPGVVVARCSSAGDICGNVFDPYNPDFEELWCRIFPGDYEQGVCAPSVEGNLQCQVGGCLEPSSNCTSSAQCGAGFFCGRDGGGPGVNACCALCPQ